MALFCELLAYVWFAFGTWALSQQTDALLCATGVFHMAVGAMWVAKWSELGEWRA